MGDKGAKTRNWGVKKDPPEVMILNFEKKDPVLPDELGPSVRRRTERQKNEKERVNANPYNPRTWTETKVRLKKKTRGGIRNVRTQKPQRGPYGRSESLDHGGIKKNKGKRWDC